jgi:hypothetical protein
VQQVGQHSADQPKGTLWLVTRQLQNFFDAGADAFQPILQLGQNGGALDSAGQPLATIGKLVLPQGKLVPAVGQLLARSGQVGIADFDMLVEPLALGFEPGNLRTGREPLGIELRQAREATLAAFLGAGELRVERFDLAGQRRAGAHLVELSGAALLVFGANLIDLRRKGRKRALIVCQPPAKLAATRVDLNHVRLSTGQAYVEIASAAPHGGHLAT